MSKHEQIRNHLKSGESITGDVSWRLYGLYRLSNVICRLRKEGLPIKTVIIKADNGKDVFAKYFIPISERIRK